MKINNFIFKKLFYSLLICLVISFSFFFIFSLLGNLGENYNFSIILKISILSALQILFYIPLFIFFFLLSIFTIFLRTHNEIIIILHYFSLKKVFLIFSIIIIAFTILELNKNKITKSLEQIKDSYVNNFQDSHIKLLISKNNFQNKRYTLIKKNYESDGIKNVSIFELKDNDLYQAIYSNKIISDNNNLISDSYVLMKGNEIIEINETINLLVNVNKIINNKSSLIYSNDLKSKSIFNFKFMIFFLFIFLILTLIYLTYFKKDYLTPRSDQKGKYIFSLSIILYCYMIINLKMVFFQNIFIFLAIFMIGLLFFKNSKYVYV